MSYCLNSLDLMTKLQTATYQVFTISAVAKGDYLFFNFFRSMKITNQRA